MDRSAIAGLLIGAAAIVGGNLIEGGSTLHLVQAAAACIVFGGTLGATILSYSFSDLSVALRTVRAVLMKSDDRPGSVIDDIIRILTEARKAGLLMLEPEIGKLDNAFLRSGLTLLIDGMPPAMIRDVMYREVETMEEMYRKSSRVFESAGGYAPTIGILGAVLGLIQVMSNVTDPSKIGGGIAVAFIATIYGVGSANLLFIPLAKKIHNRLKEEVFLRELIIEGVMGIESGVNPHFLRTYLSAFLNKPER